MSDAEHDGPRSHDRAPVREGAVEGDAPTATPPRAWPRLLAVTLAWLLAARYLLGLGVRFAPTALQQAVSLSTFRALVQTVTLAAGLGAVVAFVPRGREIVGLARPSPRAAALAVAAAPLVMVVATIVALKIAEPTLLAELLARGPGASRQNAGAFGRELAGASGPAALLWGALLAGAGEELLFRGALWGLVRQMVDAARGVFPHGNTTVDTPDFAAASASAAARAEARAAGGEVAPEAGLQGAPEGRWAGWVATLIAGVVFGAMHADLPGGVGIMRVASTTMLGLSAGLVRHASGSVIACAALHVVYNALTIGQSRGWLGQGRTVVLDAPLPTALLVAAALAAVTLVSAAALARRRPT